MAESGTEDTASENPQESKVRRNITPQEWAKVEALYETGEYTQQELADKFEMNRITLNQHMKKHNVVKGSKAEAHKKAVKDKIQREVFQDVSSLAEQIRKVKSEHDKYIGILEKLTMQELQEAKVAKLPLSSIEGNLKSIKHAMQILEIGRKERWSMHGMDGDTNPLEIDELPTLIVTELTPEEEQELRDGEKKDIFAGLDIPEVGKEQMVLEEMQAMDAEE